MVDRKRWKCSALFDPIRGAICARRSSKSTPQAIHRLHRQPRAATAPTYAAYAACVRVRPQSARTCWARSEAAMIAPETLSSDLMPFLTRSHVCPWFCTCACTGTVAACECSAEAQGAAHVAPPIGYGCVCSPSSSSSSPVGARGSARPCSPAATTNATATQLGEYSALYELWWTNHVAEDWTATANARMADSRCTSSRRAGR
jgi:hypothetical protein